MNTIKKCTFYLFGLFSFPLHAAQFVIPDTSETKEDSQDNIISYHTLNLHQGLCINDKDVYEDIGNAYILLGDAYCKKSDYNKAIELYQEALAIRQKNFGNDHPIVAQSLNILGLAYYDIKGDYAKAISLYNKALAIRQENFGDDHPIVAQSLNILGLTYSIKGDYAKAIEFYQKALAIQQKNFGDIHPSTKVTKEILKRAQKDKDSSSCTIQ